MPNKEPVPNKEEEWEKEFDNKFGQFYLKAFNSGKFFHANSTPTNSATIDFEAGKKNDPTASEDIKAFISTLLSKKVEEVLAICETIFATEVDWSEWGINEEEARENFRSYFIQQ